MAAGSTSELELFECIEKYIEKLQRLWTDIGIDDEQQKDRLDMVCLHLRNLLENMLEEEESMKAKLLENIESFGEELLKLNKEMGLPGFEPQENLSMLQLEKLLRSKLASVKKEKHERMKTLKLLKEEDQALCDTLCSIPHYIPTGVVPTKEQLIQLEKHIANLKAEKMKRFSQFCVTKKQIGEILREMEKDPDTSFEREVICENDESFLLSSENMDALKTLQLELETQQREIMSTVSGLKEQAETLWDRLSLPQEERDQFLQANNGYKHCVVLNLRKEIARCEALKLENMQKFIEKVRKELVSWWDKCYYSQEQRSQFTHYTDEAYTEELLEKHDQEVTRAKHLYETRKHIYEKIAKREELFTEMIEFEKKASDPTRLFKDRGGSMLREEKARKKLLKDLPKIEQEARDCVVLFEKTGEEFLIRGVKFDTYLEKQWEDYKEAKEREKEQRQKQRAKNDLANTPVKRRFLGAVTPTKNTPNKHRRLNETNQRTPASSRTLTSTFMSGIGRPPRPSPAGKTPRSTKRRSQRIARKALCEVNESSSKGSGALFSHTTVSSGTELEVPVDITLDIAGSYQDFAIGLNNTSRPNCRSSVAPGHPRL